MSSTVRFERNYVVRDKFKTYASLVDFISNYNAKYNCDVDISDENSEEENIKKLNEIAYYHGISICELIEVKDIFKISHSNTYVVCGPYYVHLLETFISKYKTRYETLEANCLADTYFDSPFNTFHNISYLDLKKILSKENATLHQVVEIVIPELTFAERMYDFLELISVPLTIGWVSYLMI